MTFKVPLFFLITFVFPLQAQPLGILQKKYPEGLLTNDYGVLTENDLIYDTKLESPTPYNIKKSTSGYRRWQCFPKGAVVFKYYKWKESDPLGLANVIVTLCYFGIEARDKEIVHIYTDRRARRLGFCLEKARVWNKLIEGQSHICLNGEADHLEGNKKNWTWIKARTKKGCSSLFEEDCDIKNEGLKI